MHEARIDHALIEQELTNGRPVGLRIQWSGTTEGHFVLVIGYDDSDPAEILYVIADPFYGRSTVTANVFPAGYQTAGGDWTHSYLVV
jgi:hypothetical protein